MTSPYLVLPLIPALIAPCLATDTAPEQAPKTEHPLEEILKSMARNFAVFKEVIDDLKASRITDDTALGMLKELYYVQAENISLLNSQSDQYSKDYFDAYPELSMKTSPIYMELLTELFELKILIRNVHYFNSAAIQNACEDYLSLFFPAPPSTLPKSSS